MSEQPTDAQSVIQKWTMRWFQLTAVLFVTCAVLAVALFAVIRADRANTSIQGTCQVWHDLATLPLSASTTKTGLQLVADGRIQFAHLSCQGKYGPLAPADPRVTAVLKSQGH